MANSGMKTAVDYLATEITETDCLKLLDDVSVKAVAAALGRDPMEIAFKTSATIKGNGKNVSKTSS